MKEVLTIVPGMNSSSWIMNLMIYANYNMSISKFFTPYWCNYLLSLTNHPIQGFREIWRFSGIKKKFIGHEYFRTLTIHWFINSWITLVFLKNFCFKYWVWLNHMYKSTFCYPLRWPWYWNFYKHNTTWCKIKSHYFYQMRH